MSVEFDSLDVIEKAAVGAELNRCRVLTAKIANELRNKRPEHFGDTWCLADIHSSLERAGDVLSSLKDLQAQAASSTGKRGQSSKPSRLVPTAEEDRLSFWRNFMQEIFGSD